MVSYEIMLNCFGLRQISGEKCSVATISCSHCTEMSQGTTNNYNIIVTGVTSQHKKEGKPYNSADDSAAICDASFD